MRIHIYIPDELAEDAALAYTSAANPSATWSEVVQAGLQLQVMLSPRTLLRARRLLRRRFPRVGGVVGSPAVPAQEAARVTHIDKEGRKR